MGKRFLCLVLLFASFVGCEAKKEPEAVVQAAPSPPRGEVTSITEVDGGILADITLLDGRVFETLFDSGFENKPESGDRIRLVEEEGLGNDTYKVVIEGTEEKEENSGIAWYAFLPSHSRVAEPSFSSGVFVGRPKFRALDSDPSTHGSTPHVDHIESPPTGASHVGGTSKNSHTGGVHPTPHD